MARIDTKCTETMIVLRFTVHMLSAMCGLCLQISGIC